MKTSNISSHPVLRLKGYFRDMKASGPIKIHHVYDDTVVFKDPVHEITGLERLNAYFDASLANLSECRFNYLDEIVNEHSAYIKWDMTFHHPKISRAPLTVRGVTHIRFDEKIIWHEDVYDLGSMVYEHLPVIGRITRMIKRKIASAD